MTRKKFGQEGTSLEEMGAFGRAFGVSSVGPETAPQDARSVAVTTSFFNAGGVQAILGRGFLPEEDEPEAERVAVISYRLWRSAFGGDESILGRRIELEGRTFDDRDTEDAPGVVIVGESFAERLWPGESAVGKRMLTYGHRYDENRRAEWQEVAGVAADARYRETDATRLDV